MAAVGRKLAWLIIIVALTGSPVRAQDLDHDKSAPKLFADSCASCHRSARGLAKGRFSVTLWYFLKQHYTSNSASAQALTAYLQSVDAPRTKSQHAARKSRPPATKTSAPSARPSESSPTR
jgi:mono/diheme cytochrome c family protein